MTHLYCFNYRTPTKESKQTSNMSSPDRQADIEMAMEDFYAAQSWLVNAAPDSTTMNDLIADFEDNGFVVDVYGSGWAELNEEELGMPLDALHFETVSLILGHGPSGDTQFRVSLAQNKRELIVHSVEEGRN